MKNVLILFLSVLVLFPFSGTAQNTVSRIEIQGNSIVSDATIISKIKSRAGQPVSENVVNQDIKNLIATGFFETVEVNTRQGDDGQILVFSVQEKPVLDELRIEGARRIRARTIKETIQLKEGSFIDEYRLEEAVRKIEDLYAQKGFSQAQAEYSLRSEDAGQTVVNITINESEVRKVRKVTIAGNEEFSDARILKLMKTRPAWLFNKGLFKEAQLKDDVSRIKDFYLQHGFSDAEVSAETEKKTEGIYVTISVKEGPQYFIGEVEIKGNEMVSTGELRQSLVHTQGDVFSETALYEDAANLKGVYVDKGYIFANVEPLSIYDPQTERIQITYRVTENEIAYLEQINIQGNEKTKDEVIRRELRVYPGDKFDGEKLRRSKERLDNLGFFEEVTVDTEPGSKPNWVDLVFDVKEAKTGYVSFGGGYSSIDEFIGFMEIRQRNFDYQNWKTFTGAGQDLSLNMSLGTITDRYQLSFTNPWIFDQPLSFGFDAYKKGHDQEDDVGYAYEEDIRGGVLRLSREFGERVKAGVAYRFERVEISDVVDDATQALKDEAGENDLSTGEFHLSYDTRNSVFTPSRGIYVTNTLQLTGSVLGGDRDFVKYFVRGSKYFPLFHDSVLEIRGRVGFGDTIDSTDKIPIYERFFAGGASTIRGYQERKVGPIDAVTDDPVGGEALFVANIEYTYPLVEDFLKLATFFDTGNVWAENQDFLDGDLKSSVGLGFRVKTPLGPVSVDYGWPLDVEPGEEDKEGRFHFNISRGF
ncbi:MAG: outer membrane protein assembly factor BamA [Candidatus Omnitrophica bacterium]|nr:outer membrane protein assembly factor BamA [Candidatus Omnitrophota bacterium]